VEQCLHSNRKWDPEAWQISRLTARYGTLSSGGPPYGFGDLPQGSRAEAKKNNIENEGESHDVVENKGPNFRPHDVYDK
jgi:hypothetical protein